MKGGYASATQGLAEIKRGERGSERDCHEVLFSDEEGLQDV